MTNTNTDQWTSGEGVDHGTSQVDQLERAGQMGTWNLEFATGCVEFSPWLSRTLNVPANASRSECETLFVPEDIGPAQAFLAQAAIEHMPFTVVSRMRPRASNEVIWFRHSGDPVVDPDGNLTGYSGVAMRIDQEIDANKERLVFEQTLQRVQRDESTSYLVGALSHELLNLVQPILILSDLASMANDAGDTQAVHDHLSKIETAAKSAGLLVRSTLDFARLDSDEPVPISVAVIRNDLDSFLDPEILRQVRFSVDEDVSDEHVLATRRGLVQLTLNLLRNASQASDPDATIDLVLERSRLDDGRTDAVLLSIRDRGTGFSEEGLERAFDPRFTTHPHTGGNGFGLVVVRAMVERWGGTISIGNNPDGGARVDVALPALDAPVFDAKDPATS